MPNIKISSIARKKILDSVFKKGVEAVDKSILDAMFESTEKSLYRIEKNPGKLLREGFRSTQSKPLTMLAEIHLEKLGYSNKEIARFADRGIPDKIKQDLLSSINDSGTHLPNGKPFFDESDLHDAGGLYWGLDKDELYDLAPNYHRAKDGLMPDPNVRAFTRHSADMYGDDLEVVQNKKNQVLAQIKIKGKNYYRILGATAALGVGASALSNDEANAMGIEEPLAESLFKTATKSGLGKAIKKGAISSASKQLEGQAYKESTIKKIVKGSGDWRYIILEDGSEELVHKKVINSLSREAGTNKYMTQFEMEPVEGKLTQAYKSLQMHIPKATKDKEIILDWHKNYGDQLRLAGKQIPELSLVKKDSSYFSLPTKYARLLEKEKVLKVIKDLK